MKGMYVSLGVMLAVASVPATQAATASATYAYDGRGRLVSVTFEDGKTIAYTYDAAGNRVREVVTVPASAIAAEARQDDVGG